jgi:hypothetical protein
MPQAIQSAHPTSPPRFGGGSPSSSSAFALRTQAFSIDLKGFSSSSADLLPSTIEKLSPKQDLPEELIWVQGTPPQAAQEIWND